MSKHLDEQIAQNSCSGSCGVTPLGRRDLLVLAGQMAAAGALSACGGSDSSEDMMTMTYTNTCPASGGGVVATGAEALEVGTAKVFNQNPVTQSFIVGRDSKGFFALVNVCKHAGCQTYFNPPTGSLDCPCHGSSYNLDGTVIHGPTTAPLDVFAICRHTDGTLSVDNTKVLTDRTTRVQ